MTSASGNYVALTLLNAKLYSCNTCVCWPLLYIHKCKVSFLTDGIRCIFNLELNTDVMLGVLFVSAFTLGRNHSLAPSLRVAKFSHEARIWKFIKELTLVSYRSILLDESPGAYPDQSQPGACVGGSGWVSYGAGKSFYIKSRHVLQGKRHSLQWRSNWSLLLTKWK